MKFFFAKINLAPVKSVILRVVEPYAKEFIPRLNTSTLPQLTNDRVVGIEDREGSEACESSSL